MKKVAVFIDGFNVYHALREDRRLWKYKWLDYWRFSENFVNPSDAIIRVLFFTAFPLLRNDDPTKRIESEGQRARHEIYEKALNFAGVSIERGKYKRRRRRCPVGHIYAGFEEKMTDVNIAVKLLEEGITGPSDKCLLISGDNDLTPAIKMFRKLCPDKEVHVVRPIGARGQRADTLCKHANNEHWMYESHLRNSQFDNPLILKDGTELLRPSSWK